MDAECEQLVEEKKREVDYPCAFLLGQVEIVNKP